MRKFYLIILTAFTFNVALLSTSYEYVDEDALTNCNECNDLDGWDSTVSKLKVKSSGGNSYFEITDKDGGDSYISTDSEGGSVDFSCVELCIDFRIKDNGWTTNTLPITIQLRKTSSIAAVFKTDPIAESAFFTTICLQIHPNEMPPTGWTHTAGTSWEDIISDVTQVRIITDYTPGHEIVHMDNICVFPLELATPEFQFEHEDGSVDNEFCLSEEIYLDPTTTTGEYFQYKLKVEFLDQQTSFYTDVSTEVPLNDRINLNGILATYGNSSNGTDHFISGNDYRVVLLISTECNDWVEVEHEFSIFEEPTPIFHFEHEDGSIDDEFCFGEIIYINPIATNGEYFRYKLQVQFPDQGTDFYTTWSDEVPLNDRINLNEILADFGDSSNDTDHFISGNDYNIVLAISSECENWIQVSHEFKVSCCIKEPTPVFHFEHEDGTIDDEFCFGEDIYINPMATSGEYYQYTLQVQFPDNNPGTSFYTTWSTDVPFEERINLNDILADFGDASNDTDRFIPGNEYRVVLAISSICEDWIQVRQGFTVTCCREYKPDPSFYLKLGSPGDGVFNLYADYYNLYENLDAIHEWYYFTSPDPETTPLTPVEIVIGNEFSYFPAELGLNHHVIHKIITPCGEYCYEAIKYHNLVGNENENFVIESPEPKPCELIDEVFTACDELFAPENLEVVDDYLVWSPVLGATSYIVTITTGESDCCKEGDKPLSYQFKVSSSSLLIPKDLLDKCFEWTVTAVCPKGNSNTSKACHEGTKSDKRLAENIDDNYNDVTLYPNPAKDQLNFLLNDNIASSIGFTIDLINAKGQILLSEKFVANINSGTIDISKIEAGYYLVRITGRYGNAYYKKVIVTK